MFGSIPDPYLLDASSRCDNQKVSRYYQTSSEEDVKITLGGQAPGFRETGGAKGSKRLSWPKGFKPPREESTWEREDTGIMCMCRTLV